MAGDRPIYLHDGSFEGLLTAVARAVKAGQDAGGIYAEHDYTPGLFDQLVVVQTDREQAHRLFSYMQNLGEEAARLVVSGFLSEDREAGSYLYHMVLECLARGGRATGLYSHDSIRCLTQLSRRVALEAHRLIGLIRFRVLADELLYAPIEPDCNVLGHCARHFIARLGNRRWLLHDIRRDLALYWNGEGETLESVAVEPEFTAYVRRHGDVAETHLGEGELRYREMWRSFHTVIANKDRENRRLQRQLMPRRYWKYLIEVPEG